MESRHPSYDKLKETLLNVYEESEIDAVYQRLLEASQAQDLDWEQVYQDLAAAKPLQYILQQAYCSDYTFYVDESVLIPRPETDELIYWITKNHAHQEHLKILDIGTGSGIIPISLAKKLFIQSAVAIDISEEALAVAKKNNELLGTDVTFRKDDVLYPSQDLLAQRFDLIISNPPYITREELSAMHDNVLKYEPHIALFVTNDDPLQFYKAILQLSQECLLPRGNIYLELNAAYAQETAALYSGNGFIVELKKDMQGKDRFLRCTQK